MVEILGNNLKKFFDMIDSTYTEAEITYAGNRYEVWEVSDELFEKMCNMSEEEFVDILKTYLKTEYISTPENDRIVKMIDQLSKDELIS